MKSEAFIINFTSFEKIRDRIFEILEDKHSQVRREQVSQILDLFRDVGIENEMMKERLEICNDALEFYSDKSNYTYDSSIQFGEKTALCVHNDLPNIAIEALKRMRNIE